MRLLIFIWILIAFTFRMFAGEISSPSNDIACLEVIPDSFLEEANFISADTLEFEHTLQNYYKIVNHIQTSEDKRSLIFYIELLHNNISIEMVPAIIKLVNDYRFLYRRYCIKGNDIHYIYSEDQYYVSNIVISILQKIYDFQFQYNIDNDTTIQEKIGYKSTVWFSEKNAQQWKNLWESDSLNFRNWGKDFYEAQLEEYQNADSVEADQINFITNSKFKQVRDTVLWKILLGKIKDSEYLFIDTDDNFRIDSISQVSYLLTNLDRFFDLMRSTERVTQYSLVVVYDALQKFNEIDQGLILSRLLDQRKFQKAITHNPQRILTDEYILEKIEKFRSHYSYYVTSSYDDKKITALEDLYSGEGFNLKYDPLYFLPMKNKNFSEQLTYILDSLKERIQEDELDYLLEYLTYENLFDCFSNFDKIMDITNRNFKLLETIVRISQTIGAPFYEYYPDKLDSLIFLSSKYSELECFRFFADKYYPNLFSKEELDYSFIEEVLLDTSQIKFDYRYDSPILTYSPILTLIRILELEHNTTLGFKYQFDKYKPQKVQRRIDAWIEYLEKKGLIDKN